MNTIRPIKLAVSAVLLIFSSFCNAHVIQYTGFVTQIIKSPLYDEFGTIRMEEGNGLDIIIDYDPDTLYVNYITIDFGGLDPRPGKAGFDNEFYFNGPTEWWSQVSTATFYKMSGDTFYMDTDYTFQLYATLRPIDAPSFPLTVTALLLTGLLVRRYLQQPTTSLAL